MKKLMIFVGLLVYPGALFAQILINAVDVPSYGTASEGEMYIDENNVYYLGLTNGALKSVGVVTQLGTADGEVLKWNQTNQSWEAQTPDIGALTVSMGTVRTADRARVVVASAANINTGVSFTVTPASFDLNQTTASVSGTAITGLEGNLRFVFQPNLLSTSARTNFDAALRVNGIRVSEVAGGLYARVDTNHNETGGSFVFEYEGAIVSDQFEFELMREANTGGVQLVSAGLRRSYIFIEQYSTLDVGTSVSAPTDLSIAQGPTGPTGPQGPVGPPGPPISSPTDVYHATGNVADDGDANYILGATVERTAEGRYTVTFDTAHTNGADYPVLFSMQQNIGQDDYVPAYTNVTAMGFDVEITEQDNGGTAGVYQDAGFSFYVPL
jgi:hypothetical protein